MPDRNTDDQLLQRAGAGDSAAFLSLYERHRDAVYRFAYRLSGSIEGAEDITHDCFLSLIKRPNAFDSNRASLRTYLIAAARNLWLKQLRTSSRESGIDELDTQFVRDDKQPLYRMLEDELATRVQQAV